MQTANGHRGELQIRNSTLVDSTGSGIQIFSDGVAPGSSVGIIEIGNSIIASSSGVNASATSSGGGVATFTSLGNNLTDVASTVLNHPSDIVGNPLLAPLSANGGTTPSRVLLVGSPAINAGSITLATNEFGDFLVSDQRGLGFHRTVGGTIDIGAVEFSPTVVGRHVFYNNSAYDGNNSAANANDDSAIAPHADDLSLAAKHLGKDALLPGETASFVNYTSYSRGINGIMIDVLGLGNPNAIDVGDFIFQVGNVDNTCARSPAPTPTFVGVRIGAGVNGSDRITIVWPNENPNTTAREGISKQWLQVIVKANSDTGLTSEDVHYWGNAIGETGNSVANALVNLTDVGNVRTNQTGFGIASLFNAYDVNRDTRVNLADLGIVRTNQSGFTPIRLIAPTQACGGSSADVGSAVVTQPPSIKTFSLDAYSPSYGGSYATVPIASTIPTLRLPRPLTGAFSEIVPREKRSVDVVAAHVIAAAVDSRRGRFGYRFDTGNGLSRTLHLSESFTRQMRCRNRVLR